MIFVDTSAFFALADRADAAHGRSKEIVARLTQEGEGLFTHNYAVVETAALLHHRLGVKIAMRFLDDMNRFHITWVDADLHRQAARSFGQGKSKAISFVDEVSFAIMRRDAVSAAFAFDEDFPRAGFTLCS